VSSPREAYSTPEPTDMKRSTMSCISSGERAARNASRLSSSRARASVRPEAFFRLKMKV
jgi:hypothetical protein